MHEYGLIKGVVETALAAARERGAARVTELNLVVYDDGHTDTRALSLHFETLVQGTPAQGAHLNFDTRACEWRCWSCGKLFTSASLEATCPDCGNLSLPVSRDDEVYLESIEVE